MSTSVCEVFVSHQWKPQLCRECFEPREHHHESAINKGKAFLGRVTLGQSDATPPMFVPPIHLVNARPMIDVRPKSAVKDNMPKGQQPLLVEKQTKSYPVVTQLPSSTSVTLSTSNSNISTLSTNHDHDGSSTVAIGDVTPTSPISDAGPSETVLHYVDRLENPDLYYKPLRIPARPSMGLHTLSRQSRINADLVTAPPPQPAADDADVSDITPSDADSQPVAVESTTDQNALASQEASSSQQQEEGEVQSPSSVENSTTDDQSATVSPQSDILASASSSSLGGATNLPDTPDSDKKASRVKETQQMLKDMGYLTTGDRIKAAPPVALPHLIGSAKMNSRSLSNYGSESYERSLNDRDENQSFSRCTVEDEPSVSRNQPSSTSQQQQQQQQQQAAPVSHSTGDITDNDGFQPLGQSTSGAGDELVSSRSISIETPSSTSTSTTLHNTRRSPDSPSRSRGSSVSRSRTRGPDWKPTFNLRVATETDGAGKVRPSVSMDAPPTTITTTTLQGAPIIVEDDNYDPLAEYDNVQRPSMFAAPTPRPQGTVLEPPKTPQVGTNTATGGGSNPAQQTPTTGNPATAAVSPPPPRSQRPRLSVFVQTQSQQIGFAKTELEISDIYEK